MLSKIKAEKSKGVYPPDTSTLSPLPPEIIGIVTRYLPLGDVLKLRETNNRLNIKVISATYYNEIHSTRVFIGSIIQSLDKTKFAPQIALLETIRDGIHPKKGSSLRGIKRHLLSIKVNLAQIIATLDEEDARFLKDKTTLPHFMGNFFDLSDLERELFVSPPLERERLLEQHCNDLIAQKQAEIALAYAKRISNERMKYDFFRDISNIFSESGELYRSMEVSGQIPDWYFCL